MTDAGTMEGLQAGTRLIVGQGHGCVATLVLGREGAPHFLLTAGHVMPAEQSGLEIRRVHDRAPIGTLYVNLLDQWPRSEIGLAYPYDAALIELNPHGRKLAQNAARTGCELAIRDVATVQEGRFYQAWQPGGGKSVAVHVRQYPNQWRLQHPARVDPVWVRDVIEAPPIMNGEYAGAPLWTEEQGRMCAVGLCVHADFRRTLLEPLDRIVAACERIVGDVSIF